MTPSCAALLLDVPQVMALETFESLSGQTHYQYGARLLALLSCIRFREVVLLQATPLMGLMLGAGAFTPAKGFTGLHLILASTALVAYVFCLNDWAGIAADLNDPNKAGRTFAAKGVTTEWMAGLAVGFGFTSLFLFSFLPLRTLALACLLIVLGLFYSFPNGGAKGIPFLSSGFHLIGGITHFLIGYSAFTAIDVRGVQFALYFGLVFAAGHLNQEVRDYGSDRRNGILTNAVRFGKRVTFLGGFLIFTCAYSLLAWIVAEHLPLPGLVGLLVFYFVHALLFWTTYRGDLTHEAVRRHQMHYRVLHGVIGLALAAGWLGLTPTRLL